ncbi:MAG: phosphate ABC transporter ATP-binding protein PstB [Planctomycetaceae bacterium]|jgi:phosphate transport system ATP-binding protein|nr:phosphate ABC transporter ATP-binding protein PstB [Planctomycetaceae bacterium]
METQKEILKHTGGGLTLGLPSWQQSGETAFVVKSISTVSPDLSRNKKARYSIIRSDKFSLYYGNKAAVNQVSMEIETGCVTAIIGPSGCGKSSFLRSINRMNDLIPNTRVDGSLVVDGRNIYDKRVDLVSLRRRVGMVFQRPNPFPKSVFDNIAYGPRLHGVRNRGDLNDIVETCLKRAALWDEVKETLSRSALALSGGQQQRLCIARALATQPDVLLMDEPCSALDPIATGKIEELIVALKEQYTIVIVTHNMQQAARISDRTAFFCLGELIEYDDTNKIFTSPSNPQTEAYITGRFG